MYVFIHDVYYNPQAKAAELNKIKAELDAVQDKIKDANHVKPEVLEEKIRKAEEKIEYETNSIVEEKNLQRQVAQWRVCLHFYEI